MIDLDRIRHAKAYPFPAPAHCFEYEAGAWRRLDTHDFDRGGRVPVLAAGSNQSPEQLIRKYADYPDIGPIQAQRGRLGDFDCVYAAHLSSYSSVPATFQRSPGTRVIVFVLWMTEAQLVRMHQTEGNYTYDHLRGIDVALDAGGTISEAFAYSSKIGCLNHQGGCVGLAEIAADGRVFPALGQEAALTLVCDRLAPGLHVDDFVRENLEDDALRRARSASLGEGAIPAGYDRHTVLVL
jgi:hypothetical protein